MEEEFLTKLQHFTGLLTDDLQKKTRKWDYVIGRYFHIVFLHKYIGLKKYQATERYGLNHSTYINGKRVIQDLSFYPNKYNSLIKQYPKLIA